MKPSPQILRKIQSEDHTLRPRTGRRNSGKVKKQTASKRKEDEAQPTDVTKNPTRKPFTVSMVPRNREKEFREGEEQLDSARPHTKANSPGLVWFEHGR